MMAIKISGLIEQAAIEKNSGNYEKAIRLYFEAIEENPQHSLYYHLRAILYIELERYELALNDLSTAICLSPSVALNFYHRGNANLAIGELYDTALDYDEAIKLQIEPPYNSFTYVHKGLVENRLSNFKAAFSNFNKALLINPDLQPALIGRCESRAELNDLDSAYQDISKAIVLKPNVDVLYQKKGSIELRRGRFKEAIENYDKARSLNPNNVLIFHNIGLAYEGLNKKSLAISSYSMLIPHSMGLLTTEQHYVNVSELLKFRTINELNLRAIEKSQIWFAHPDKFADTKDGKYLLKLFPKHEVIKQTVSSILVYSCFGMFLNEDNLPDEVLTKHQNVMWAEYGDSSRGICLHYQYNPEQATKANKFSFDKITYVENVETINQEENTSLFDTIQHGFFTKDSGFNFENEARFITMADENSKTGKTVKESDLGLTLIAIDFGISCSNEDKLKVMHAVNAREHKTTIEFYQLSTANLDSYELNKTKINR